ncbi:hypothetical protein [Prevotella nigrescens]|nr:hypothetical protein [Prevotella nigrescens]
MQCPAPQQAAQGRCLATRTAPGYSVPAFVWLALSCHSATQAQGIGLKD